MNQAVNTINAYLSDVVEALDKRFGEGYAAANPALVGAMVQACALDFAACYLHNALDTVADSIDGVGANL
jgi:hypothetical protein